MGVDWTPEIWPRVQIVAAFWNVKIITNSANSCVTFEEKLYSTVTQQP